MDDEDDLPEPPPLRRLRRLVTALTVVSILGVVAIVSVLVIRLVLFQPAAGPSPVTAEALSLPHGETITAMGRGAGTLLLTTTDQAGAERVRSFDEATGAPLGVTLIERE
ncbi:MAG: DUF6476 family protein [Pseudomonadota bacterium]